MPTTLNKKETGHPHVPARGNGKTAVKRQWPPPPGAGDAYRFEPGGDSGRNRSRESARG